MDRDRNKTHVWCYEDAEDRYLPLVAAAAAAVIAAIATAAAKAANR